MSLNWLWENKCGTLTARNDEGTREWECVLYDGNALMIALAEWEEDGKEYWQMCDFWSDEDHMERILKDRANEYKAIRLNTKKIAKSKLNKILKACIKYGIEITLYAEEEGAEK